MKTNTETLIKAMRILATDLYSEDYVANSAVYEAADRLEELAAENETLSDKVEELTERLNK